MTCALKEGAIVGVAEVKSGLACGCVCPACGERLVAKKGPRMMHHFAHCGGQSCAYGYETSLHLAAKEVLSRARRMVLPAVLVTFPTPKEPEVVSPAREIHIDRVELERREGEVVPDVVVYAGGKRLFVEIFVTHRVDGEKLEKLRKMEVSTLEIDLSRRADTLSFEELAQLLLTDHPLKQWRYNAVAQRYLRMFWQAADRRPILRRGLALHVDFCPIRARVWRGRPYANYLDDCAGCGYFLKGEEQFMLCSGRHRIATLADLLTPLEARFARAHRPAADDAVMQALIAGICPNCGAALVQRHGPDETCWTCSSAPHCRFSARMDAKTGAVRVTS